MSHDHSRHGSCSQRVIIPLMHSVILSLAGDVTAVVVGSGALLGQAIQSEGKPRFHRSACCPYDIGLSHPPGRGFEQLPRSSTLFSNKCIPRKSRAFVFSHPSMNASAKGTV